MRKGWKKLIADLGVVPMILVCMIFWTYVFSGCGLALIIMLHEAGYKTWSYVMLIICALPFIMIAWERYFNVFYFEIEGEWEGDKYYELGLWFKVARNTHLRVFKVPIWPRKQKD